MDKKMKKNVNYMAWGLVAYSVLSFGVIVIGLIGYLFLGWLKMPEADKLNEERVNYFMEAVVKKDSLFGCLSCISVIVGVLFLFLFFRKRIGAKALFVGNQRMTPTAFGKLFCVFMGVQLVAEGFYWLIEKAFNLFGYSVISSIEESQTFETNLYMILYAAIIGPIAEELIYRGFVLRTVEKYGKVFAIVISSVLFGVMHANIPQAAFAVGAGLVLGYVAVEYSIGWAILLHMINNGIVGQLLYVLIGGFDEAIQNGIMWAIMIVFFVAGAFFIWREKAAIGAYIKENKPMRRQILHAFTAIGVLVFIVMELLVAFNDIQKISM